VSLKGFLGLAKKSGSFKVEARIAFDAVCLALISTSRVEDRSLSAEFSCSDKEGAFSINSVPVGTYLLAVNRTGIISSDEPFRTFYYPGVAERTSAKPVTIGAGEGRFAIRILKGSTGSLYGSMFSYIGEFLDCPELEKAIRRSGEQFAELKTSPITVRAEEDLNNIEFQFPFPGCTKAKAN
jgi:hypothetical protein